LTVRRFLLGFVVLGLVLVLGSARVGAQEAPAGRLRLVSQTTWLAEDQTFSLAFTSTEDLPEQGTLELTLYGAATNREALTRGHRDPTLLGDVRDTISIDLALLTPGGDGAYRLHLRTDGTTSASLPVGDPGVYPLQLAVADADGTTGRPLLTSVVRVDDEARASRLRTALVLPLHADPAFGPDGGAVLSDRARHLVEVRTGLLERYADVPLSVAPTPETLEALAAEDEDLLADVRSALADRHVIAGPYVRIDLAAFAADDNLTGPLTEQFAAGRRTLRRLLRQTVDQHTWVGTGNPTSPALDALAGVGIDRGVFRAESIVGDAPVTEPVEVTGVDGQQLPAYLADAMLRTHVNSTADPVLMAHRALADLALLASPPEEGGVATDGGDAGVVVELAATRPLPAGYLDTLLRGLDQPGPLRPVNLSALFDAEPAGEAGPEPGPDVEGIPVAGDDLGSYGQALELSRTQLSGYTSFAGRADPLAVELRRRQLVSGSADLTAAERSGYLRSVSDVIRNRTSLVTISDDETITLTSREGDIPVTVENGTGEPVEITLEFDSDNRLDFPDGSRQRVELAVGANRIDVPVVARTSGAFPLRITATSPDGVLTVTRARITVRSTVVSGVGLVLSIGALLVLAVWWISHWRSTRRNRRLVDPEDLPVNTDPAQASTGDDADPPPV
jgi:hypothetical protein